MKIQEILNKTDATLIKRTMASQKLIESEELRKQAVELIKNRDTEYSLKALMVLEVFAREHFEYLKPYLPSLIIYGKEYNDSSSRRCLSKIYNFAINSANKFESNFNLSNQSKSGIIEQSFLWLVSKEKTAVKVFCMQNLYELREEKHWISDQLKGILEKDMAQSSAGFKSRGIKILRKLKQ